MLTEAYVFVLEKFTFLHKLKNEDDLTLIQLLNDNSTL